jgi:hypothetical protein
LHSACMAHGPPGRSARGGATRMLNGGDFTDTGGGRLCARRGGPRLGQRGGRGAYRRIVRRAEGAAAMWCMNSEAAGTCRERRGVSSGVSVETMTAPGSTAHLAQRGPAAAADGSRQQLAMGRHGGAEAEVRVRWHGQRRCARTASMARSDAGELRTRGQSEREPVGPGLYPRPRCRAAPPRSANRSKALCDTDNDKWAHMSAIFQFK